MNPKRIYIISAQRTPVGAYRGGLAHTRADDLLASLLVAQFGAAPFEAVYVGCANQAGEDARNIARLATLRAGLPETLPGLSFNSLCASSVHSLEHAFLQLKLGRYTSLWAGGVESMSRAPLARLPKHIAPDAPEFDTCFGWRFANPFFEGKPAGKSMLEHAEAQAKTQGYTTETLDAVVRQSIQKYQKAEAAGRFDPERLGSLAFRPNAPAADEPSRPAQKIIAGKRLPPIVEGGIQTAAHASAFADGAAGMVLCNTPSPFHAERYATPIALEVVETVTVACPPQEMPNGGLLATQKLLQTYGFSLDEVACFEFQESFAGAHLHQCKTLGLHPLKKGRINALGGSFAFGAPMGAQAARGLVTLAHRLAREAENSRPYGVYSTCVGMGLGVAILLKIHFL